jgi:anaerobic selenocysteine-containing dehydrogenase
MVNPADAERLGLNDGGTAALSGNGTSVEAPVEVTEDIMPGVVSVPHGWGHSQPGTRMATAQAHAGVNCNALIPDSVRDVPSGNAVLNGVPVDVSPSATGGSEESREAVAAK